MLAVPDIGADVELISLQELEDERYCESAWHASGTRGHADGPLLWLVFHCGCRTQGVTPRCTSWVLTSFNREFWVCAGCDTLVSTHEWFDVLGQVH